MNASPGTRRYEDPDHLPSVIDISDRPSWARYVRDLSSLCVIHDLTSGHPNAAQGQCVTHFLIKPPWYLIQARPGGPSEVALSIAFTTMFSSSLRVSLVAFVASAVTVSAAPGLTLKTSTPDVNINGLGNLKVTTTITNSGDETLKLLNDPRGVLDSFPENSFTITDAFGSSPSFVGAKVNRPSVYLTDVFMHPVPPSRSSTVPHTQLALTIQAFSPFLPLVLPQMSLTIVSRIIRSLLAWTRAHGTIVVSLHCLRFHRFWLWRLLRRAIKPFHLHRC